MEQVSRAGAETRHTGVPNRLSIGAVVRSPVAGIVAAAVGVPIAVSIWSGSFLIPHNDDWAYTRIAQTFAATGHFQLVGWNRAFLLGQIVILGPLAGSSIARHLFVAFAAAAALLATFALLRARIGRYQALFGMALVAAWPGFGLLSTSFMTDIPSYATMALALCLADAAHRRRSSALLAAALGVGIWSFTIREQAVAALAAIGFAALSDSERRARAAPLLLTTAALCLGLELWRHGLANADAPQLRLITVTNLTQRLAGSYFTLALPLLPLAMTIRLSTWGKRSWLIAGATAAGGWYLFFHSRGQLFSGNYLTSFVAYPQASARFPPIVLPVDVWALLLALAILSGALLAGALAEGLALDRLLGTFAAASALILIGEAALGQAIYGRNLLLFVPIFTLLIRPAGSIPRPALLTLLGLAVVSGVLMTATLSYDGAVWRAASSSALPPRDIDAGFAWVGAHGRIPITHAKEGARNGSWYLPMFPERQPCFVLAPPGPSPAKRSIRTFQYQLLPGVRRTLVLVRQC